MIAALIPAIAGVIGKAIDKAIPDRDQAEKLKAEVTMHVMEHQAKELQGAIDIILAEAQGGWLQRNWRPMLMIWFAILVGAYWFGFVPDNLTPESIDNLFRLVQIGIGGYIVGRSGEKIMREYKK